MYAAKVNKMRIGIPSWKGYFSPCCNYGRQPRKKINRQSALFWECSVLLRGFLRYSLQDNGKC